ncbi:unnamed protein product [marine sediment metagenome]|uniref:Uncharacterized protein n=1 Tax=marine sediment metagenome TaxID=412755 RepID=X0TPY2_9ZZZZ
MDNLIHMLDDLIELARDGSSALRFSDRGNEMLKKMYTVGIYATILELASDISFLIKRKCSISSPIVLRSLFEMYVELLYIIHIPDGFDTRFCDSAAACKRGIKHAAKSPDPSFDLVRGERAAEQLAKINDLLGEKYTESKLLGRCTELDKKTAFKLEDHYRVTYRLLSLHAHPYYEIITKRHRIDIDPNNHSCTFEPKISSHDREVYSLKTAEFVCNAISEIHDFLAIDIPPKVSTKLDEVIDEFNKHPHPDDPG